MKDWKKKNESLKTIQDVILHNTGVTIDELLNPQKDPLVQNLDKAVEFIKRAIKENKPIHIIGDYDCDGVLSTTILYLSLQAYGCEASVRFPRRFSEGYGLSMKIIDEIDDGVILTVDNGIAAIEQVKVAKAKGLDVVVLDHHLRIDSGEIPEADVIVDPNALDGSEFNEYCGAGIAYRFAKLLIPKNSLLPKLLAFAGVATVADVMKLLGDNRNLVKGSIESIQTRDVTAGFNALLDQLKVTHVTEGDYGFKLGPIINAAGRLDDDGPLQVFNLLKVVNVDDGLDYFTALDDLANKAKELIKFNTSRQNLVTSLMSYAYDEIKTKHLDNKKPIILYNPAYSEGIIGIIAGRIAEEYKTPCICFTDSSTDGILKGSGRTYGDIHLKNELDKVSSLLVGFGGHAGAAGLSCKKENLTSLQEAMEKSLSSYSFDSDDSITYDLEIDVKDVKRCIAQLERFAPFGEGNPQITFKVNNFDCIPQGKNFYMAMGNRKQHIKLFGNDVSAVMFDMTERYKEEEEPKSLTLVGMLSQNWFRGKSSDQIEVIDFKKNIKERKEDGDAINLEELLIFH